VGANRLAVAGCGGLGKVNALGAGEGIRVVA
jgi:hypothetical protein